MRYGSTLVAPLAGTVGANNEGLSILGGYGTNNYSGGGGGNAGASFWGGGGAGSRASFQQAVEGTAYGSGSGGGSSVASYHNSVAAANGVCFIMEFK